MADRVTFTRPAAERIGKAVRVVEAGDRVAAGWSVDMRDSGSAPVFRVCTFTGSWAINSSKTVTLRDSTATLAAYNLFGSISASCGGSPIAVAKEGTAWYVIAANCT
jgi:hypothetical protein